MNDSQTEYNLRTASLVLVGLIAISTIILQAWLSLGTLDIPAFISAIALAVALPSLTCGVLINHEENMRKEEFVGTPDRIKITVGAIGITSAAIGIIAAFWHISWIIGVVSLASMAAGLVAYYVCFDSATATPSSSAIQAHQEDNQETIHPPDQL